MNSVEEIFQKSGAILKGHFLLVSGLHSPIYWEKFRVLQLPNYTEQLCRIITTYFLKQRIDTEVPLFSCHHAVTITYTP